MNKRDERHMNLEAIQTPLVPSCGSRVVTLIDIVPQGGRILHPKGAVGLVVAGADIDTHRIVVRDQG